MKFTNIVIYLLITGNLIAQSDSLQPQFNGLDLGINVTGNFYQKQKVTVWSGTNYLNIQPDPGFEFGFLLNKHVARGKFGIGFRAVTGYIPIRQNFLIERDELLQYFPEDFDYRMKPNYNLYYVKYGLNLTYRKKIKNRTLFSEIGLQLKHMPFTRFRHRAGIRSHDNSILHNVFYFESNGPENYYTVEPGIKFGSYAFFLKRFMLKYSAFLNLSFSNAIQGAYQFYGFAPSGNGDIKVRQSFLGVNLDIIYKGLNSKTVREKNQHKGSLKSNFKGLDFGITYTQNVYQKESIIVNSGNDYFVPRHQQSHEFGFVGSQNFNNGKWGTNFGLKTGSIPVDLSFSVPEEDIIFGTNGQGLGVEGMRNRVNYKNISLSGLYRISNGKMVGFLEAGFGINWLTPMVPLTETINFNGSSGDDFSSKFYVSGNRVSTNGFSKIGTYVFNGKITFKPSIIASLSFHDLVKGDYSFFNTIPSGDGQIHVSQSYLGINLEILYSGKN